MLYSINLVASFTSMACRLAIYISLLHLEAKMPYADLRETQLCPPPDRKLVIPGSHPNRYLHQRLRRPSQILLWATWWSDAARTSAIATNGAVDGFASSTAAAGKGAKPPPGATVKKPSPERPG